MIAGRAARTRTLRREQWNQSAPLLIGKHISVTLLCLHRNLFR